MKKKRLKDRNYTLDELDCQYCLHFRGNGKPCPLSECCCVEERKEALRRRYEAEEDAALLQQLNEMFA